MACYDRVNCSVDPATGALTINTKSGSCTIEPGDTVTFTETGVGYIISINGEPNIIPKPNEDNYGDNVSFTETDDSYVITINGEPNVILKPNEDDYGDNVSFTETDDSYIVTINNEPNVISKNCLQLIDCNGDYIDPCVDRVATCENLQEAIGNLPDPDATSQTRVQRGTGNAASQHTLTANHDGTWPNEQWRETWMERNGDIVTIHSWNPDTSSWDSVAIEAPEDLVILNNPVIYLRPGGSANPPINHQDDLTVANAFNSMNAIRNFMNRTLVVGLVTIDGRGAMNGGGIGPAQFKNAQNIVVRGDPADPTAFSFQNAGLGGAGAVVTGGNVVFQDMTFIVADTATAPSRFGIVGNTQGGTATLRGAIRFNGFYNASRTGSAPSYVMTAASGGVSHIDTGARITLDFTNNTELNALFSAFEGGTFSIGGDVEINVTTTNLTVREIIYIQQASYFVGHMGTSASPVVTGNEINATLYSIRISPLASSIASSANDANWGNNVANFMTWDWGQPTGISGFLSEIGVHGGNIGPYP